MFDPLFNKFTGKVLGIDDKGNSRVQLTCTDEEVSDFVIDTPLYFRYEKRGPSDTITRKDGETYADFKMRKMGYKRVTEDWFASSPEYFSKGTKAYRMIKEGLSEGKTSKQIQNQLYKI